MAFFSLITEFYVIIADFALRGSARVAVVVVVVVVAAVTVVAALIESSSASGGGSAAVVYVDLLFLALSEADGVDVCVGVVLEEGCREGRRAG